jgi:predicted ATPase
LDLLKQSNAGNLEQTILRLGGMLQLCWNGFASKGIGWYMQCEALGMEKLTTAARELTYELVLGGSDFSGLGFHIVRELLADYDKVKKGQKEQPFKFLERDLRHSVFFDSEERRLTPSSDRIKPAETLVSQVSGLVSEPNIFFLSSFLDSWGIYHDLIVSDGADVRKAAVTRRETRLAADGQNLIPVLHTLYTTNREFKDQLNSAMRAAFGRDFDELEFPPAEDQRIQMRVHWRPLKSGHSTAELSEGTLRFLMLISILANPFRGALVAVDEPECFLHPSMFPIVADLAWDAAKTSQVVFTTHSPQFLDALGERSPVTTVTQTVNGETQLRNVEPGELQRWLDKYTLGDLFKSGELEALT